MEMQSVMQPWNGQQQSAAAAELIKMNMRRQNLMLNYELLLKFNSLASSDSSVFHSPTSDLEDSIFQQAIADSVKTNDNLKNDENNQANQKSSRGERYKTELCRQFSENGFCKYGKKCQFAHGMQDLRTLNRHPKYKTETCRTFHTTGFCPYGSRCHFIHGEIEQQQSDQISKLNMNIIPNNNVKEMLNMGLEPSNDQHFQSMVTGMNTEDLMNILKSLLLKKPVEHEPVHSFDRNSNVHPLSTSVPHHQKIFSMPSFMESPNSSPTSMMSSGSDQFCFSPMGNVPHFPTALLTPPSSPPQSGNKISLNANNCGQQSFQAVDLSRRFSHVSQTSQFNSRSTSWDNSVFT